MQLISSAFQDGDKIPAKYVRRPAGGQNLSVPLSWSGAPDGTQSFALSMVDPHPVAHNWVREGARPDPVVRRKCMLTNAILKAE